MQITCFRNCPSSYHRFIPATINALLPPFFTPSTGCSHHPTCSPSASSADRPKPSSSPNLPCCFDPFISLITTRLSRLTIPSSRTSAARLTILRARHGIGSVKFSTDGGSSTSPESLRHSKNPSQLPFQRKMLGTKHSPSLLRPSQAERSAKQRSRCYSLSSQDAIPHFLLHSHPNQPCQSGVLRLKLSRLRS